MKRNRPKCSRISAAPNHEGEYGIGKRIFRLTTISGKDRSDSV